MIVEAIAQPPLTTGPNPSILSQDPDSFSGGTPLVIPCLL